MQCIARSSSVFTLTGAFCIHMLTTLIAALSWCRLADTVVQTETTERHDYNRVAASHFDNHECNN